MYITTAAAAAALDLDLKSIDNILSREGKHLIRRGKQGVRRRIDDDALAPIAIAIVLKRELGVRDAAQVVVHVARLDVASFA